MIDKEIIKIASNTENHGVLDNHTHFSKLKNAICGDEMRVYLIVKDGKIANFKYECESCIYCYISEPTIQKALKINQLKTLKISNKQKIVLKIQNHLIKNGKNLIR